MADGCQLCRRKRPLLIYHVIPRSRTWRQWDGASRQYVEHELPLRMRIRAYCLDRENCRAHRDKKAEKSRIRGSLLVLEAPKAPNADAGFCRWCGDEIKLDQTKDGWKRRKSRRYHRGDSWEQGDRDCQAEYDASRTWQPRIACWRRDKGVCAECGRDCSKDGRWAADHRVPLADGGEHTMENLQTLCDDCHGEKTAAEAKARARNSAPVVSPLLQ